MATSKFAHGQELLALSRAVARHSSNPVSPPSGGVLSSALVALRIDAGLGW